AVPPINADGAENVNASEIFVGDRLVRDVRGDFDQFACPQDHLFAANLEVKRSADTVAELLAVVLMQWHDTAFSQRQERHRDFVAGEESARKKVGDMFFGNFVQLVVFHFHSIKIDSIIYRCWRSLTPTHRGWR